jgi:hypothetical protein
MLARMARRRRSALSSIAVGSLVALLCTGCGSSTTAAGPAAAVAAGWTATFPTKPKVVHDETQAGYPLTVAGAIVGKDTFTLVTTVFPHGVVVPLDRELASEVTELSETLIASSKTTVSGFDARRFRATITKSISESGTMYEILAFQGTTLVQARAIDFGSDDTAAVDAFLASLAFTGVVT